jgi:multiple sugar transport system substrate-binding protein
VIDRYVAIYRKGCTPPASVTWDGYGNNKEFLAQSIVMTINQTLSTVNALKRERPEDYYKNAVSVEWPIGAESQPLVIETFVNRAAVLKAGGHTETAKEFVRFLAGEGWLGHYLDFAGERMLPPMPALLQGPFWLNPGDPHRMRSAMQLLTQPRSYSYAAVSGNWRHSEAYYVWPKAVHRVAAEGISPEQAVNEAIARVKQLLSE